MNFIALQKSFTLFMGIPIIENIFLEVYHILNQHEIYLRHLWLFVLLLYGLSCLVVGILYKHYAKTEKPFHYQKYYYPLLILSLGFMASTIPMVNQVNEDFFESANKGLSIYEFLKYGKIPLLESYNAHMLGTDILGILYGLLNQDFIGASFNIYQGYEMIFFYLLFYYVLKNVMKEEYALLTVLFFPLANDQGLRSLGWGLLAFLAIRNVLKKQSIRSYILLFLSLVFLCFWRLDIGFSATLASLSLIAFMNFKEKKKKEFVHLVLTFGVGILMFLLFYVLLCLWKNINPITRAFEFLKLSLSNVNWSYIHVGNPATLAFSIVYFFLPCFVSITLAIHIYQMWKEKEKKDLSVLLLFLGLFYLFNVPRGLVRHSLSEMNFAILFNLISLYIPLWFYEKKENISLFWFIYLALLIFTQLLYANTVDTYRTYFDQGLSNYSTMKVYHEDYNEKVQRVRISPKMQEEYQELQQALSKLLKEGETYLDFTNQTLLYALMDYQKPVYVNQSPGLLSGEYTQKRFLEEIQSYQKVPIAIKARNKLLSEKLDEIPNEYRYYLISEYINENYEPILVINDYEIWMKKEEIAKREYAIHSIKTDEEQAIEIEYDLGYLPYIWGTYDEKEKQIIEEKECSSLLAGSISNQEKEPGTYLEFEMTSSIDQGIKLEFQDQDDQVFALYFMLRKGTHSYQIRISAFEEWYQNSINHFTLSAQEKVNCLNYSFLKEEIYQNE